MDWEDAIVDLVESHWNESNRPYPLSRLKLDLRKQGIEIDEKLGGRKLREVLEIDFSTTLRVFRNPDHELAWYMVSSKVDLEEGIVALKRHPLQKIASNTVEYDKAIFTAFIKEIFEGKRRFVFLEPKKRFDDFLASEDVPEGGIEVLHAEIVRPSGEQLTGEEKRDASDRIRTWLSNNDVQLEKAVAAHRIAVKEHDTSTLGDVLDFSGLSVSDKARILIPLDVLLKIKFRR